MSGRRKVRSQRAGGRPGQGEGQGKSWQVPAGEWDRLRETVMQLQELHRWQSRLLVDLAARVEGMTRR